MKRTTAKNTNQYAINPVHRIKPFTPKQLSPAILARLFFVSILYWVAPEKTSIVLFVFVLVAGVRSPGGFLNGLCVGRLFYWVGVQ